VTQASSQSLDSTSFSDEGSWSGLLFPGAGEMTGRMILRSVPRSRVYVGDRCSEREGAARAARVCRRFVVANELRTMVTTTFARWVSVGGAVEKMTLLMRRCRYGRDAFPFLWTLERGGERGRVHGHLLVPVSYGALVEECWPHGHVDVMVGDDGWTALRDMAGYVAKDFDSPVLGSQRYRIPKGFQPEAVKIEARSRDLLVVEAEAQMGSQAAVAHHGALGVSASWEA